MLLFQQRDLRDVSEATLLAYPRPSTPPLHASTLQVLVERTLAEVAGTLLTAELALKHGVACNTAGGTHHAHRDHGSGFCILNDLAVTAAVLLQRGAVQRVLIVDLDVHQVLS
jgi:acetoin utilization deacetylase AcuC-like enzyme